MLIHQCMLHHLFKIVLFQLNSTTMRNSVVLVEFWKANFFFCQRNTRENKLKTYKSISDGPSVFIITLTLNFDIYLRAENTSFYMFVITVLQNTREIIFLCKSICEHYHFVIVQFLIDFFLQAEYTSRSPFFRTSIVQRHKIK